MLGDGLGRLVGGLEQVGTTSCVVQVLCMFSAWFHCLCVHGCFIELRWACSPAAPYTCTPAAGAGAETAREPRTIFRLLSVHPHLPATPTTHTLTHTHTHHARTHARTGAQSSITRTHSQRQRRHPIRHLDLARHGAPPHVRVENQIMRLAVGATRTTHQITDVTHRRGPGHRVWLTSSTR
jgi:hypothetical protein